VKHNRLLYENHAKSLVISLPRNERELKMSSTSKALDIIVANTRKEHPNLGKFDDEAKIHGPQILRIATFYSLGYLN
jgi:hypothetical protein